MASKVIDNRVNFGSVKNPMPFPDFLDVQLKSFKDFLQLDTPPEFRSRVPGLLYRPAPLHYR